MTDTAIVPGLQVVWSYYRTFLFVLALTFLGLASAIFLLIKPVATVRCTIDIGSIFSGGREQWLEPPELVAKRIHVVYAPSAVVELADKGVPALALRAMQNSSVETAGGSIAIVTTIDASAQDQAKLFQQEIADRIVKEHAARAQLMREALAAQTAVAKRTAENVERNVNDLAKEKQRVEALLKQTQTILGDQQVKLERLHQSPSTSQQSDETMTIDARVIALQTQITALDRLAGDLLALGRAQLTRDLVATRNKDELAADVLAKAEESVKGSHKTRVSQPPVLMPMAARSRRPALLLVAFIASLLLAFGAVIVLHDLGRRRI